MNLITSHDESSFVSISSILDGRLIFTLSTIKVHGVSFKKRAPRAIKEIKKFAFQQMVRCPPAYVDYERDNIYEITSPDGSATIARQL